MTVELKKIIEPLLQWYEKEKRDLPWRHTTDPYKILVSEIMLQQTRVETVKEYYLRFMKELPTMEDLANVEEEKLLKLWEGLGYYSRAKNLKKCAQIVVNSKEKTLPSDYKKLTSLPGIGPYAAGSIASIAFGQKTPAIDGNVLRVMTRLYEDEREITLPIVRKHYFDLLQAIMPENTRDFTESLMELGALVCLPNTIPLCEKCPLNSFCQSYHHQTMLNFPTKKKMNERKIEEKTILIFQYQNTYAIQKRPSKGLLASMYEFLWKSPKLTKEEVIQELKKEKIEVEAIEALGEAKQIFSHIKWHMIGYHIIVKKPFKKSLWVTKDELKTKYSLPNAYKKYAKKIGV